MDQFEKWLQDENLLHEASNSEIELMRKAWNGALTKIQDATEIHDTMGDIKGEVGYLKSEKT